MNLYTLISKHGTIRRVIYGTPTNPEAEQAAIDRQEYQLAYDFHAERRASAARQEVKDAKEMMRLFARGIERVEDAQ